MRELALMAVLLISLGCSAIENFPAGGGNLAARTALAVAIEAANQAHDDGQIAQEEWDTIYVPWLNTATAILVSIQEAEAEGRTEEVDMLTKLAAELVLQGVR